MHAVWTSCCKPILFCPSPGSGHGRSIFHLFSIREVLKEKIKNKQESILWKSLCIFWRGKDHYVSISKQRSIEMQKLLWAQIPWSPPPPKTLPILPYMYKLAGTAKQPPHPQDLTFINYHLNWFMNNSDQDTIWKFSFCFAWSLISIFTHRNITNQTLHKLILRANKTLLISFEFTVPLL